MKIQLICYWVWSWDKVVLGCDIEICLVHLISCVLNVLIVLFQCCDLFLTWVADGSTCLLTDLCQSRYLVLYPAFCTSFRFGKVVQKKKLECNDFLRILWKKISLNAGFVISAWRFVNLCHAEYFSCGSSWRICCGLWEPDTYNCLMSILFYDFHRKYT